jgi:crossover junction endodeoxyribonuclease RuvC|tara:strand:- start:9519 stop:9992 length:474 start_codon:yes stop_codon:yes gene_type:complete
MNILAIDPGYERVGIAIIKKKSTGKEELLYSDCFTTSKDLSFPERLKRIGNEIDRLIHTYKPERIALEKVYFNKNQKTAMMVSEARGVLIYVATVNDISVYEYTPLEVKMAVTGNGHSPKDQVQKMVCKLIPIEKSIRYDDEYDAIAVGLTASATCG